MGLPEYDPVRLAIEGSDGLDGTHAGTEVLNEETAGLWMAGKEFRRDQSVGDRVGKNEKTRVTCKLQNPGSGPPGREPGVSEDERKAMMAYYFKRQEELKRLAEVSNAIFFLCRCYGWFPCVCVLSCCCASVFWKGSGSGCLCTVIMVH